MTSQFLIFIIIPIIGFVLLLLNFTFAPHNPYKEKKTPFECGYHSWLMQNRNPFSITFFLFGLLFLVFDLEIVLIYPYTMSSSFNGLFGLWSIVVFTIILSLGFMFELGKKALKIDTLQEKNTVKYSMTFDFSSFINKLLLGLITFLGFSITAKCFFSLYSLYSYTFIINIIAAIIGFIVVRAHAGKEFTNKELFFVGLFSFVLSMAILYLLPKIFSISIITPGGTIITMGEIMSSITAISYALIGEPATMGPVNGYKPSTMLLMDNGGEGPSSSRGRNNGSPSNETGNRGESPYIKRESSGNNTPNAQAEAEAEVVDNALIIGLHQLMGRGNRSFEEAKGITDRWNRYLRTSNFADSIVRKDLKCFEEIYKGRYLPGLEKDLNSTFILADWIVARNARYTSNPAIAEAARKSLGIQTNSLRYHLEQVEHNSQYYGGKMDRFEEQRRRENAEINRGNDD